MNINNSTQVDMYLQNEMSSEERTAFEEQLSHDAALQEELNIQRRVINAAVNAGIKAEFAKAIHKKTTINRSVKWGLLIAAGFITMILLYNYRQSIFPTKDSIKSSLAEINSSLPFINPPLAAINVPFSEYDFDAEKGATIFHSSGSIIYFPPSALVDASGTAVKGHVKVTYREFADPLDFFVSGIPMGYDSAGVHYNFESSGMCEINAYKDNKAVFVNKDARPEIHLSGKNKSPLHNVYFLDSVSCNWKYEGKDIITEVKNTVQAKPATTVKLAETGSLPVKPVKPARASDDKQVFSVEIAPGSFEELFAYDGLKFQVEDESSYRRSDAAEQWDNVKLDHTTTEGIYMITFSNSKRKVSYKVRPVLEGADYDAAIKIFDQKNAQYEEALQKRIVKDHLLSDSINLNNKMILGKMKDDDEWNTKINNLIIARNKKVRELKQARPGDTARVTGINQVITMDNLIREENEKKFAPDIHLSTEIVRSFSINNFGVWNCDHPEFPREEVPLYASLIDSSNNNISLPTLAVVYGGFNGIAQFPSAQIRVIPGKKNMIWGIIDKSFYYFTYKDFEEAMIDRNMKAFTFRMRRSKKKITSYDEIRELVGNM